MKKKTESKEESKEEVKLSDDSRTTATEETVVLGVSSGIESHPDYDPSLPESKQRHLR